MTAKRTVLVLALAGSVLLAGCSFGGGTGTDTPTPAGTDATVATTTAVPGSTTTDTNAGTTPTETTTPTPTLAVTESATEIRADAVAASKAVEEYHSQLNSTIRQQSNNVERTVEIHVDTALDRAEKAYRIEETQSVMGQSVTFRSYLSDETLRKGSDRYVRAYSSEWIEYDVTGNVSIAMEVRDVLERYRQSLGNATVSVAGVDRIDGVRAQVLHADVNVTAFREHAFVLGNTDIHEVEMTVHVAAESDRILRVNATINETVTTQAGAEVDQVSTTTVDFEYDPVSVTFPEASESAVELDGHPYEGLREAATNGSDSDENSEETSQPETTSSDSNIAVKNGSLPTDPDTIFANLQSVAGTNATEPNSIVVLSPSFFESDGNDTARDAGTSFREQVGLTPPDEDAVNETVLNLTRLGQGFVTATGNVHVLVTETLDNQTIHKVTAHELVHYIQFQQGRHAQVLEHVSTKTTDGTWTFKSVIEGVAVATTDAYLERFAPEGVLNSPMYELINRSVPPGSSSRYSNSWYVFGGEYVKSQTDVVTEVPELYENPPTTSEQVLHGLSPESEPPANLSVAVETGEEWRAIGTDRMGEAFVRFTLENGVSPARAASGADGWGNDSLHIFRSTDGNVSYVWTLRFDDAANASEFETVFEDYLDEYGTTENGSIRVNGDAVSVERPDEKTVAVTFAPESFVEGLAVSSDGGTIRIETP